LVRDLAIVFDFETLPRDVAKWNRVDGVKKASRVGKGREWCRVTVAGIKVALLIRVPEGHKVVDVSGRHLNLLVEETRKQHFFDAGERKEVFRIFKWCGRFTSGWELVTVFIAAVT
jgi:hypothetical protein